jgi:hypothetical protein
MVPSGFRIDKKLDTVVGSGGPRSLQDRSLLLFEDCWWWRQNSEHRFGASGSRWNVRRIVLRRYVELRIQIWFTRGEKTTVEPVQNKQTNNNTVQEQDKE